jgi:hypothetical protein
MIPTTHQKSPTDHTCIGLFLLGTANIDCSRGVVKKCWIHPKKHQQSWEKMMIYHWNFDVFPRIFFCSSQLLAKAVHQAERTRLAVLKFFQ